MSVSQYPTLTTQQPCTQTTAGDHPQQQPQQPAPTEQSSDVAPQKVQARPVSAFLKRRDSNKKVSWDHSVVDNEKAPKTPSVRPSTPPLLKKAIGFLKGAADPSTSQHPSTSTAIPVPVANTSVKMNSPSVRPPQSARPSSQGTYAGQDPWYQPSQMNQRMAASGRPQTYVPSSQKSNQAPAANSASKRKSNPAAQGPVLEIRTSVSKGVQQAKIQRPSSRIPPAVPDAPQPIIQSPPPTPRITRLPTPDLPEVGGTTFCTCDGTNDNKPVHLWMNAQESKTLCTCDSTNCNKTVHLKMDIQSKTPSGPAT